MLFKNLTLFVLKAIPFVLVFGIIASFFIDPASLSGSPGNAFTQSIQVLITLPLWFKLAVYGVGVLWTFCELRKKSLRIG
jgi:hypothetical protein